VIRRREPFRSIIRLPQNVILPQWRAMGMLRSASFGFEGCTRGHHQREVVVHRLSVKHGAPPFEILICPTRASWPFGVASAEDEGHGARDPRHDSHLDFTELINITLRIFMCILLKHMARTSQRYACAMPNLTKG
jgi:hypothetical protein